LTLDNSNGLIGALTSSGLSISFDAGSGKDQVVLLGNATGLTEEWTIGSTPGSATLTTTGNNLSQTLSLTGVEEIVDTVSASDLTVNGTSAGNLFQVRRGPTINGTVTNRIETADRVALNLLPRHDEQGGYDGHGEDHDEDNDLDDDGQNSGGSSGNQGSNDQGEDSTDDNSGGNSGNHSGGNSGNNSGRRRHEIDPQGRFSLTFANKTTVTINGLGGDDLFSVSLPTAAGLQTLNLNGGEGTDVLTQKQIPSNLQVNPTSIELTQNGLGASFIQDLYARRLGRLASESEVRFWSSFLSTENGRTAVTQGIETSEEAASFKVRNWYAEHLNRAVVGDEARYWINQLRSGQTEEQVLSGILSSEEYLGRAQQSASGSTATEQFVRTLYREVLHRQISAQEVDFWNRFVGNQGAAGRQAALAVILASEEFRHGAVNEFYQEFLHRDLDDTGFAYWVRSNTPLSQVRAGVGGSEEAFSS